MLHGHRDRIYQRHHPPRLSRMSVPRARHRADGSRIVTDEPEGYDDFILVDEVAEKGDAGDPRTIAADLVATDPDHAHLRIGEVNILFLFRRNPKFTLDKMELGSLSLPSFGGKAGPIARWLMMRVFGSLPDFVMILDHGFWVQAPQEQRIALVDHELTHAIIARNKAGEERFGDDGRPVFALRPHDIEEFNRIVQKHGAWKQDIAQFLAAAGMGGMAY
jgi:hypothetical protein